MSKLRAPIKDHLESRSPSPAEVNALWDGVDTRLRPRKRTMRWLAPSFALTAGACAIAWLVWFRPTPVPPVELATGTIAGPRVTTVADGSRLELDAGAVIDVLASDANHLDVALRSGRCRFEVATSARRWTVTADGVTVEVTGAKFAMWRADGGLTIQVFEGSLVARGEEVPDRVRRVDANQTLTVPPRAARAPIVSPPPSAPAVPAPTAKTAPAWRALADEKNFDGAYELLGKDGVIAQTKKADRVDDLLRLSDIARLSHHPSDAIAPLARIVDEFAKDSRAAIAAFTLGRVYADDLRKPEPAAAAFARAIALGLPDALVETAYLRRIESLQRIAEEDAATETARAYREKFPNGKLRKAIDELAP